MTEVNSETLVNVKTMLGSTTSFPTTTGPGGAANSSVTRVATNVANVTLKAANTSRRGLCVYKNSPGGANLFLKLGATAAIGAGVE